MTQVRYYALTIDSCRRCQLIWFDQGEIRSLTHGTTPAIEAARIRVEASRQRESDRSAWQLVCGWLGLPFEQDAPRFRRAYVTFALAAAFVVAYVLALFAGLDRVVADWGFLPARMWRHEGATWITAFFLHGGWWHLLSNAYFLVAFGGAVEEDLDAARYLVLVVLGAILGCVLHASLDPRSDVPVVGASAGISALLFYYAFRFPKARIGYLWCAFLVPVKTMWMNARTAFVIWLLLQLFLAYDEVQGTTPVSALGHLGGVLAGLLFVVSQRAAAAEDRYGVRI